ncbi:nucleoside phosphorylase [Haladaptatus cibarius]|uniref:nucleoside phosphorylase n=1 Tax=Haladaptatus cibarius TaxID=453847 RepID=UPI0006786C94|nr:nucleoside phosphorylase [Haladaptatus cibarius]
MPVPKFGDKYDARALFSPEDAVEAHGGQLPEMPPAVIFGFEDELFETVDERATDTVNYVRNQELQLLDENVGFVGDFGIGPTVTAIVAENVIAAGAEVVCLLCGCASLQKDVGLDEAILPTRAIRDEGVSHHYLPADEQVEPTPKLVDRLDSSLIEAGIETHRGATWSMGAMYRETIPEIEHYANEGVLSLGMAESAMLAVAAYRGVDAAVVHEVGDYLTTDEWKPNAEEQCSLPTMLNPTIEALRTYVS